jgi:hypothetical protein
MATKSKWEDRRAVIFDNEEYEHIHPLNPIYFYDDFLGAYTALPAGATPESGCTWATKIVGAGTVALVADGATGIAQCALTNANQKQDAGLYWADDRRFLITQGVVFEARVKVSVLPTDVAEAVWGLIGDWADGPDNITYSVFFTADGSGEIFCEKDDDNTNQSATSGVTVLTTDWKVYRIDCRDVTSIKFYINGARVASGTTFPYVATGANATLQPYFGPYKATGTGVGTIQVDYVRIWGNRS